MENKMYKTPEEIFQEREKAYSYKNTIGLYDNVQLNQAFVNGDQWGNVNAPSIEKPVLNFCAQAKSYSISMLVSDDIAVTCELEQGVDEQLRKALESITSTLLNDVFESVKFKENTRYFLGDAYVNGDAYFHWWYNTKKNLDADIIGAIDLEIVDNINLHHGNPAEYDIQKQPYIIIEQKLPTQEVKEMVDEKYQDQITSDVSETMEDASTIEKYTIVMTRFWKENGQVWWCRATRKVMINEPVNLETRLYPIAKMGWRRVKNSCHGISPITEARPNQIMVNKIMMILYEILKKTGFFKILFDKNVIKEITNKTEAIGVNGSGRAISDSISTIAPNLSSAQPLFTFLDTAIDKCKAALGIYDVALGNAKPENTSAIIALQKTASQPLELQRLDYLQVVEDCVRIIIDLMSVHYGVREVPIQVDGQYGTISFDFKDLDFNEFGMNVEVGQAAYWSELTQIRTIDNLFKMGIIDAKTYVEIQPTGIIPKKNIILEALAAKQQFLDAQAQMMQQQSVPQTPMLQ